MYQSTLAKKEADDSFMSLSLSDLGQVVKHDFIDEAILLESPASGDLQLLVAHSRRGKTYLSLCIYDMLGHINLEVVFPNIR